MCVTNHQSFIIYMSEGELGCWKEGFVTEEVEGLTLVVRDKNAEYDPVIDVDGMSLQVWDGSRKLSGWMRDEPELVKGKNIMEIGSGVGLASLVAARLGAESVLCTEYTEIALSVIHQNIVANNLEESCRSCCLDWDDPNNLPSSRVDVVVASDILFLSAVSRKVAALLNMVFPVSGTLLMVHELRYSITTSGEVDKADEPLELFFSLMKSSSWEIHTRSDQKFVFVLATKK
eukprot:TRINITY_DN16312_c0_g1_i1.p1 TRINITY_DN16312_c0_g1~~TRINITY_DN16312_c0_g1_i1.p1  ORF type:complete len:232 (+),score=38.88 TRINITY_DN16312_c0_g1_i1:135-830(+)